MEGPLISICIPAYKNISYLGRLLKSISEQTFTDYEVILTDDSPDDSVRDFVLDYHGLRIAYFRNSPALGTPENWNEGLRRASGTWVKIMHDDDWFAGPESLQSFADAAHAFPGSFLFSAYTNHFIETGATRVVHASSARIRSMLREPYTLLSKNIVGPPSVTMHRNDGFLFYDKQTKWVVDIDFYIRRMQHEPVHYIDKPLVNVGMSAHQVTVDCINNRKIQVPENFHLLQKVGEKKLGNLLVYDAWWRLMRNLEVTRESDLYEAGLRDDIPAPVRRMIRTQRKIPRKLLTNGFFSKSSMFVHYLLHRNKIGR